MPLIICVSSQLEQRLVSAARWLGIDITDMVIYLLEEHLPPIEPDDATLPLFPMPQELVPQTENQ